MPEELKKSGEESNHSKFVLRYQSCRRLSFTKRKARAAGEGVSGPLGIASTSAWMSAREWKKRRSFRLVRRSRSRPGPR
jgi:hypothetical protein